MMQHKFTARWYTFHSAQQAAPTISTRVRFLTYEIHAKKERKRFSCLL